MEDKELLVSIIVPAYNVERYIAKCLRSLLDQDLAPERYEILVVDDSSPDGSRRVAEELAAAHPNIHVLEQRPNAGQATARNSALDRAQGRYILFVDSDDYIEPHSLGEMVRAIEQGGLDMLALNYRLVDEQGGWIEEKRRLMEIPVGAEPVSGAEFLTSNRYACALCLYMFRRAWIERHGLRMLPLRSHEDEEFIPRAICLAQRVGFFPRVIYYYLQRGDSTTGNYTERNLQDLIECAAGLDRFLRSGEVEDPRIREYLSTHVHDVLRLVIRRYRDEGLGNGMDLAGRMKRHGLMPVQNPGHSVAIWMINHMPRLYFSLNKPEKAKKR